MDYELRKKILREELISKHKGKKKVTAKYRQKYPESAEREYLRLVNRIMGIQKEIIMKHLGELKKVLGEQAIHFDSKKENEMKRKKARLSTIDNSIVRMNLSLQTIRKEVDSAIGMYGLKKELERIAGLNKKLTISEWKKVVHRTLGIDIFEDFYSGDFYKENLEKWIEDNVNLIVSIPKENLERMQESIFRNYMSGATTTSIIKEIQKVYGLSKSHAKLIARDQTSKLNAAITESQQRDAGVEMYEWSGVRDSRERKSHLRLEGKIFSWDNPPETDKGRRCHPGQDYQCRCCALPVFDFDKLELL